VEHDFQPTHPEHFFTHICVNCDMKIVKDHTTKEVLTPKKLELHPDCDSFSTHQTLEA
jgi:hypothetical protein